VYSRQGVPSQYIDNKKSSEKWTLANSLDLEFGSIKKYENLGIAKDVFSVDIKKN